MATGTNFSALLAGSLVSAAALLVTGWVILLLLNQFFFSPLKRVPGPKLAALSTWYEAYYDVIKPGQYAFKVKQLHAEYGPIVRVGPNEVSIADPNFVDTIYAPGTGHKRDKEPARNKALGLDGSIGGTIPHDLHRRRREALNPFFSPHRIGRLEPQLATKVSQLDGIYSKAAQSGEVLNMSDVYFALANDIVYKYCFGNNLDLLSNLNLAHVRRENIAAVLQKVKIMRHFSWIRTLTTMLPHNFGASSGSVPPGVRDMIAFRHEIRLQIDAILARAPSLSPDEPVSIFTHLRDMPDLPPAEKSGKRLEDEAGLLVMAGTYSPMLSLIVMQYHLIAHPEIRAKLRNELATNPSAKTAAQLIQLPYLNSVVQEAHRLSFGLTGRNPRVAPEETLVYTDNGYSYTLPPGTLLSASTLLIHTNESVFPDPWKFDPERWLPGNTDAQTLAKRRRCMLGFLRGPRVCIGQHLANQEMAIAAATAVKWNMDLFETSEDDVRFLHDYHVMSPRLESKGVRVIVKGRMV